VVEHLLHEGHELSVLMGMSVKQMWLFSQLATDRKKTELAAEAGAVRVAFHADKKQYVKFLEELDDDG
jgi:hypothetical protein